MKLLLLGAGGQVGTELRRARLPAGMTLAALDRAGLDITDAAAIAGAIRRERPGLVVNAAAYTAVDRAESKVEARLRSTPLRRGRDPADPYLDRLRL
jgi:dTDP-4-dehydrorhamnose reductase